MTLIILLWLLFMYVGVELNKITYTTKTKLPCTRYENELLMNLKNKSNEKN